MAKPYVYSLEEYEPYAQVKSKVDELRNHLHGKEMVTDLRTLSLEVDAARQEADDLEADALIDSQQAKKAQAARKKADDLSATQYWQKLFKHTNVLLPQFT